MNESTIYSVAGLQEGITALRNAHKELTTLLEDLKGELKTSLGQWEDNARLAYLDVQAQWDASAQRQQNIIERMPVLLNNIAEGYNATENQNTGVWNRQ